MAITEQTAAPLAAHPPRTRRRGSSQARADARLGFALVTPAVLTIIVIAFYPLLRSIWDSMHKLNLRFANMPRPLIWFQNYKDILQDARWHNALAVTARVVLVSVGVELVLGMIIALLLNRAFHGRGIVRASILVPWAITTVVSAQMWSWIYDARYGVFNDLLMRLHIISKPIIFLAQPNITIWAMIGAEIWKTTPFMALLLMAGMQLIPADLYEAAAIDGTNAWQNFWKITLPLMKPTILVALLFRTIDAVRIFDLPRVLTNGGPGQSTETLVLYAYNTLFTNLNFGYGSALAVSTFLVVVVVSFLFIKILGAPAQGGRS
ncbi:MAG: sugar ABC transporter permease [Thermomicrobia bacterium]|nr:sugar ABC transporter permease [Thermomicrobia bacterium]